MSQVVSPPTLKTSVMTRRVSPTSAVRAPRHVARHFRVGRNALEYQLGVIERGRAQRDPWTVEHLDVRHGYIVHRCRRTADVVD